MTLVVIQRKKETVTFDSDSRLSMAGSTYFDQGAKLFEIPIRIRGPLKSIADADKWEFELLYGMAITGSSLNAYALKESISQILSHITYSSNASDISIIGICHFILARFKDISSQLMSVLRRDGLSEIIIGGYCLVRKQVRIFRFYPTISDVSVDFCFEEVLETDGLFFSGSGKPTAIKIREENPEHTPMQIIKSIIEGRLDLSVGGLLQHGIFKGNNFSLGGVTENIYSEETGESKEISHFLGFELSSQKISNDYPMLFISYGATPVNWKHRNWKE